ncbi:MAG: TRAP transporter small permease [Sulfitobacter sp.]
MKTLARLYDLIILGLAALAGAGFAAITVAIAVDVVLRNFGMRPFQPTSALVEYSLLFATIAAGPWLVRQGGHVAVDSFAAMLPGGLRRFVGQAVMAMSVLLLGLLSWRAALGAVDAAQFGSTDMRSINIPYWIAYAMLSLGFGLMATEVIRLRLTGQTAFSSNANH